MFVSLFSRSTGICDDLEFLPEEELSNVQLCALHMEMTNTEQLLRSMRLGPVPERRDKQYQVYQFIPGIAIYYHLARCNKFIPDFSLNSAIPSFRNRSYSGDTVISGIRHIYTWNRVILPFRNRPLVAYKKC